MMTSFELHVQQLGQESRVFVLHVRWYSKIKDIKDMLHIHTGVTHNSMNLYHHANSSVPLSSSVTLHDLGIDQTGYTLRLSIVSSRTMNTFFVLNSSGQIKREDVAVQRILIDVRNGLQRHQQPVKTDVLDCTGGVYFMRAVSGQRIAVFKPSDEEGGMPNNPKGYKGNGEYGLRPNFMPGFGCMREVAAYVMDVNNFCGVPPTLLVHCEHPILNYPARGHGRIGSIFGPSMYPKMGSLQQYVQAGDLFEDLGSSVLSDFEVQKIALLDLRLLNCDRNASNILALRKKDSLLRSREGSLTDEALEPQEFEFEETISPSSAGGNERCDQYQLVPIDHGYSLPSKLLINEIDWAWFYYPQVARPVHEDIRKYVQSLDIDAIVAELREQVTLSEDSLFLVRVAHMLVVDGITAGLTLFDIASIVARTDEERPSALERAIEEAEENAHRTVEMRVGAVKRAMSPAYTFDDDFLTTEESSTNGSTHRISWSGGKRHRRLSNSIDPTGSEGTSSGSYTNLLGLNSSIRKKEGQESPPPFHSITPRPVKVLRTASSSADFVTDFSTNSRSREEARTTFASLARSGSGRGERAPSQAWIGVSSEDAVDPSTPETVSSADCVDADADADAGAGTSADRCVSEDEESDVPDRNDYDDEDEEAETLEQRRVESRSQFWTLQGTALRSIQTIDVPTSPATFPSLPVIPIVSATRPATQPLVVTVSSLASSSSGTVVYDSTDSEYSSKASTNAVIDKIKIQSTPTSEKTIMVPAPVRVPQNVSFKRLSVTPVRRPSPLQIGSADPFRHRKDNRSKLVDTQDADGYNANDEEDTVGQGDEEDWYQNSPLSSSSPLKPLSFLRVTSFSAFSSAPLYDAEGAERRVTKMRKERRRRVAQTEEFSRLRVVFLKDHLTTHISKMVKVKLGGCP